MPKKGFAILNTKDSIVLVWHDNVFFTDFPLH